VPKGYAAKDFTKKLLQNAHIVGTPGTGLGKYGEGWFRLTLCADEPLLAEAARRIKEMKVGP